MAIAPGDSSIFSVILLPFLEVCYPFVTNFGAKVNKKTEKEKEFMTFCLLIPSLSINLYIFQLRFMPFCLHLALLSPTFGAKC